MGAIAALDVSQEETAICLVEQDGAILAEAKVPTCPDAIASRLTKHSDGLDRVGMETGPLAVWLWNALAARQVPIVCLDARHANGAPKMMPNKTDRHDARGLAQIVRTGWFKAVQVKSHDACVNRAPLRAREALVGMRVRLENEIRGLLKTFGVMFGKRVGGFRRRAEEIIERELTVAPDRVPIFEALMQARRDILARIAALDSRIRAIARQHATVRLLMTAPGVGPITAMAVVAAFDDAARFRRSSISRADAETPRVRVRSAETAGSQGAGIASPASASTRPRTPSAAGTSAAPACVAGSRRLPKGQDRARRRSLRRGSWPSPCMPCGAPTPPSGRWLWHRAPAPGRRRSSARRNASSRDARRR